jgi:hypothetical protein
LRNLFGYFKNEPVRVVRKLFVCLDVTRSYKHYWAIVQFKQSINPFKGSISVDLQDNEQFSDNLLLTCLAQGSEQLRHLNLQNTLVTSAGLAALFSRPFNHLTYLNIENAGPSCDIATAIDEGGIQTNIPNLKVIKYSPPLAPQADLEPPKKKKKVAPSQWAQVLSLQCPKLQIVKLGSSTAYDFLELLRVESLVEIDLTKPIIGNAHVEQLAKLKHLKTVRITEPTWEKGFADKQLAKWTLGLDHLTLSKCKLKDADIEPMLTNQCQIKTLDLSYNDSIVGKVFGKLDLTHLQTINLSGCKKITGKNLESLVTNASRLDLSQCDLKDAKVKTWASKIPGSITYLNLAHNDLSDETVEKLVTNANLRHVDFSGNINLYQVEKLVNMETVILNNVTSGKSNRDEIETGVNLLLRSTTLRVLHANSNKIKKLDASGISLTELDLADNEITDKFTSTLFEEVLKKKKEHPLEKLNIASNHVSYDGVALLEKINKELNVDTCNLRRIDLSHNPCATDNAIMSHDILDKVSSTIYKLALEFLETQDGYDSGHDSDFEDENKEEEDDHVVDDDGDE